MGDLAETHPRYTPYSDPPLELQKDPLGEPKHCRGHKDARRQDTVPLKVCPAEIGPDRIEFAQCERVLRHCISLLCFNLD